MDNLKNKILVCGKHMAPWKERKDGSRRKAGKSKAKEKSTKTSNNLPQKCVSIKQMQQVNLPREDSYRDPKPGARLLSLGVGILLGRSGARRHSQDAFFSLKKHGPCTHVRWLIPLMLRKHLPGFISPLRPFNKFFRAKAPAPHHKFSTGSDLSSSWLSAETR